MSDEWTGGEERNEEKKGKGRNWERKLLEQLALDALKEKRRARRWGVFFKLLMAVYFFTLLYLARFHAPTPIVPEEHTALVDLQGVIAPDTEASADNIVSGLRAAFEAKHSQGVILRINSPGGSPVQARYIYDEIHRLREKYPDKKLYAVVSDVCASGGYYVAAAADEIYVDKASIVGSIGVRMDGFGFVEAIDKLGIERRLLTAGEHKGFLDPFLPARKDDIEHVQGLLDDIHRQFIAAVKEGRGERLKDDPRLFSGLIWTGDQGVELGLADGFGSASYVAREIIGAEEIIDYTPRPDFLERFSRGMGVALGRTLAALAREGGLDLRLH